MYKTVEIGTRSFPIVPLNKYEVEVFNYLFDMIAPLDIDGKPAHCVSSILRKNRDLALTAAGVAKALFERQIKVLPDDSDITMDLLAPQDIGLDDWFITGRHNVDIPDNMVVLVVGLACPKSVLPINAWAWFRIRGRLHPAIFLDKLDLMVADTKPADRWVAMSIVPFLLAENDYFEIRIWGRCKLPDDYVPQVVLNKLSSGNADDFLPLRIVGISYFRRAYERGIRWKT